MKNSSTIKMHNDVEIPIIGFGTWQLNDGHEAYKSVRCALAAGYKHIDTATIYGNERTIGRAIGDHGEGSKREDIFITTKVWNDDQGFDATLQALDVSLKKLGTNYVDLYLVHWPVTETRLEAWRALEKLYKDGKAKAIGVSNYMVSHIEELLEQCEIRPMVNQIELHPFNFKQREDVVQFCADHDIIVEAYSPVAQAQRFDDPVISQISVAHNVHPAQVMIRYLLQKGTVPLPRSTDEYHITDNINVFNFELSDGEMNNLDDLNEDLILTMDPKQFD